MSANTTTIEFVFISRFPFVFKRFRLPKVAQTAYGATGIVHALRKLLRRVYWEYTSPTVNIRQNWRKVLM